MDSSGRLIAERFRVDGVRDDSYNGTAYAQQLELLLICCANRYDPARRPERPWIERVVDPHLCGRRSVAVIKSNPGILARQTRQPEQEMRFHAVSLNYVGPGSLD